MKQNYLFAPVILLVILILSFFGSYAYGQSVSDDTKVKKEQKTDNEPLKIIVKNVEVDCNGDEKCDSLLQKVFVKNDPNMKVKVIQIKNGDTIINKGWGNKLNQEWAKIYGDSDIDFDFDSIFDPINFMSIEMFEDGKHRDVESFVNIDGFDETIQKHIEMLTNKINDNIIVINDDGENIKIERKGEMVFINKEHNVKDVDSLLDFIEDEDGNKVIVVQTRIVLDELSDIDKDGLKAQGIKTGKEEPNFDYVKFYPNPTTDGINVNFKLSYESTTEVKVTNMLGQIVYEEKLINFSGEYQRNIPLKEHGKGPFILQIIQGKHVISRKILIE